MTTYENFLPTLTSEALNFLSGRSILVNYSNFGVFKGKPNLQLLLNPAAINSPLTLTINDILAPAAIALHCNLCLMKGLPFTCESRTPS